MNMNENLESRLVLAFEQLAAQSIRNTELFEAFNRTVKSKGELEAMDLELRKITHPQDLAINKAVAATWTPDLLSVAAKEIVASKVSYQLRKTIIGEEKDA